MDHEELTQEEALDLEEIMRLIDMYPTPESDPESAPEAPAGEQPPAEPETKPANKPEKKEDAGKSTVVYLHDLVYLLVTIVLVFLLCFRIVVVSGDSMNDTLVDGDYLLLLSNVFYADPQPGDIIVASKDAYDNGTPIIKRVIAVAGQTVDIDFAAGIVYVDGIALTEPYILSPTTLDEGVSFPLVVDDGCVFVLGDNRSNSKDSRSPEIGLIDTREVVGRVIFLIFPGDDGTTRDREFDRIGVLP